MKKTGLQSPDAIGGRKSKKTGPGRQSALIIIISILALWILSAAFFSYRSEKSFFAVLLMEIPIIAGFFMLLSYKARGKTKKTANAAVRGRKAKSSVHNRKKSHFGQTGKSEGGKRLRTYRVDEDFSYEEEYGSYHRSGRREYRPFKKNFNWVITDNRKSSLKTEDKIKGSREESTSKKFVPYRSPFVSTVPTGQNNSQGNVQHGSAGATAAGSVRTGASESKNKGVETREVPLDIKDSISTTDGKDFTAENVENSRCMGHDEAGYPVGMELEESTGYAYDGESEKGGGTAGYAEDVELENYMEYSGYEEDAEFGKAMGYAEYSAGMEFPEDGENAEHSEDERLLEDKEKSGYPSYDVFLDDGETEEHSMDAGVLEDKEYAGYSADAELLNDRKDTGYSADEELSENVEFYVNKKGAEYSKDAESLKDREDVGHSEDIKSPVDREKEEHYKVVRFLEDRENADYPADEELVEDLGDARYTEDAVFEDDKESVAYAGDEDFAESLENSENAEYSEHAEGMEYGEDAENGKIEEHTGGMMVTGNVISFRKGKDSENMINAQDIGFDEEIGNGDDEENRLSEKPCQDWTEYSLPPLDLLESNQAKADESLALSQVENNAKKLVDTLASFGVGAKVVNISKGPAVTRYELQPNVGVKVSKIVNLADDIALNLAATGVRIEAPIPGKAAVGIEVPNKEVRPVFLREVIESQEFINHPSKLSFAVGKDIAGKPVVADIAKMPHLLIAGATGSGKSVCINTLIASILFKAAPSEVKLLMVDPKVVELSIYNGIPHLLIPVVTDPKKAAGALNWAVTEMLSRYKMFADNNVRDLKGYNALLESKGEKALPQVVIIIDELADLMMVAPNEVEDSICRLAQMARAAGMHLVIATQRPSVDVITGVIKANIPSRISFAVSSQIDSRTILDMAGAEKLLGRGDMLFSPISAPKPVRVQGAFISDREVENIVSYIKSRYDATESYDEEILQKIESQTESHAPNETGDEDELLNQAIEIVIEQGHASTSFIQRKLKIGYARAARILDQMEAWGIVGPSEGSKPRQLKVTKQEWQEMNS